MSRVLPLGTSILIIFKLLWSSRVFSENHNRLALPQPSCDKSCFWFSALLPKASTAQPAAPASAGASAVFHTPGQGHHHTGQTWRSLSRAFPDTAPHSRPGEARGRETSSGAQVLPAGSMSRRHGFLACLATKASDSPTWGLFLGELQCQAQSSCCSVPTPTSALFVQCTRPPSGSDLRADTTFAPPVPPSGPAS